MLCGKVKFRQKFAPLYPSLPPFLPLAQIIQTSILPYLYFYFIRTYIYHVHDVTFTSPLLYHTCKQTCPMDAIPICDTSVPSANAPR